MSETTTPLPLALPLTPPLKWAGGKRWLVPQLAPLWKPYAGRRFVEPFCGALAVTLSLTPERALLNDANPHLVNFLQWLKRGLVVRKQDLNDQFLERPNAPETRANPATLHEVRLWMANDKELYYSHRKRFNDLLQNGQADSAEAAALFYFLNRTCFNGLCRFNSDGLYNVPFGRYKTINYLRDFTPFQQTFARWQFTSVDFESVPLEPGDFVYADPPFDVQFTQYAKEAFSWDDQVRAAEWLARHDGPVLLSNQATNRIIALYEKLGFKLRFLPAPRRISCTGDRTPVREVLAVKRLDA